LNYQPDNNFDSWQELASFYEHLLSKPGWDWLQPVLEVVQQVAISDRANNFRAGHGAHIFIVSTKETHGLEEGDLSIWVIPYPEESTFFVKYLLDGMPQILVEERICRPDELYTTVNTMMDRLWADTRGKA
jgi:hypothetical protein